MNKTKDVELCSRPPSTPLVSLHDDNTQPSSHLQTFAGQTGICFLWGHQNSVRNPDSKRWPQSSLQDIQIVDDADLRDFQVSSVPVGHSGNFGTSGCSESNGVWLSPTCMVLKVFPLTKLLFHWVSFQTCEITMLRNVTLKTCLQQQMHLLY